MDTISDGNKLVTKFNVHLQVCSVHRVRGLCSMHAYNKSKQSSAVLCWTGVLVCIH